MDFIISKYITQMLNNLINKYDAVLLCNAVREGKLGRVLSKLTGSKQTKIADSWRHIKKPPTNWYDIPAVNEHWNLLISGRADIDYNEYISRKYFSDRKDMKALSLGCGTGHRELRWAGLGNFEKIDAYDLSINRIEYAKKKAEEAGYENIINYQVGDIYGLEKLDNQYDVILMEQSLHHFSPLRNILLKMDNFLKPHGFAVINEFVGPTRFQWTDRQLDIINGLLSVLPVKYKKKLSGGIKNRVYRPSKLNLILSDPSEAVESSNIIPLLKDVFNVMEIKEYGGTILMMLLSEIGHNFLSGDKETRDLLDLCFNVEDVLIKHKEIQSDFVVAVCRKE